MKRILYLITVLFFICSLVERVEGNGESIPVPTGATGTPSVYEVTQRNFYISSDGGYTWKLVKAEAATFDIAAVASGEAAGNFFAGSFTPGTYNKIKFECCATFRMRGYVAYGGTTYYTSTTASNGTASTTTFDPRNPPSDYGIASITVPKSATEQYSEGEFMPAEEKSINIVIKKGANSKINMDFDISKSLALYNFGGSYRLMPAPPSVTVSVE